MTYREAGMRAAEELAGARIEYADTESRLLMEHICQADFGFYLLHAEEEMPGDLKAEYRELVNKRCAHIPLQHLTGVQEFMGIPILVSDRVLIPRQDTEILAEEAIRILQGADGGDAAADSERKRVLDLCTGSGCIAVAIKCFCPGAEVCGSDISAEILAAADGNAKANDVKVQWIESDLLSEIAGPFDLIVSNPPYIPTDVIDALTPEVRDHEPRTALDGGADGLDYYRRIIPACGSGASAGGSRLARDGYLLLEIGSDQADAVRNLMERHGFSDIRVIRDLAGLDRVVEGRLSV